MGRLLAIGDIHGHRDKLSRLLDLVQPGYEDTVVFMGDYVDRGPNSPGTIKLLLDFKVEFPETVFLAGNHDHLLLSMLSSKGILPEPTLPLETCATDVNSVAALLPYRWDFSTIFYGNGGVSTESQYKSLYDVPDDHLEFFASLKLFHEEERDKQTYFFVHAGIRPGVLLADQTAGDMLWIRDWEEEFIRLPNGFDGRIVVRGHDHWREVPGTERYLINLDSGVYFNPQAEPGKGVLTCCDVTTRQIWQI